MFTQHVELNPREIAEDHPFTDPAYTLEDLAHLQYIRQKLELLLKLPDRLHPQARPWVIYLSEPGERRLRVVFSQPERLLAAEELIAVGFCGQKLPEADRALLEGVDAELLAEFPEHPHLLCYASLELEGGDWCNLVLFGHLHGIAHWTRSGRHGYAAIELAPKFYRSIRLHNLRLPGGVLSDGTFSLIRTKYYDYGGEQIWWAVRELPTS